MTHNNAYGFPVPDPTDDYRNTPAAIQALVNAVTPRLGSRGMVFVDTQQYMLSANGRVAIDQRAKLAEDEGAVMCAVATPPYGGNFMQYATYSSDTAGTFWLRALVVPPPADVVQANGAPLVSYIVWGQPK